MNIEIDINVHTHMNNSINIDMTVNINNIVNHVCWVMDKTLDATYLLLCTVVQNDVYIVVYQGVLTAWALMAPARYRTKRGMIGAKTRGS